MPTTMHTLTGTFSGYDVTNVDGTAIITASVSHVLDTTGNRIFVGPVIVPIGEDGTFTVSLPATNDATLNPSGFTYTVLVKFSDGSSLESVPFALTAATNLNSVVEAAEALVYAPGGTGVEPHSHDEYLTQAEADLLYAAIGSGGGTGTAGTAGSKWLSGAGAPASGTGVVTDWYLNTTNYDIYEKTTDTTWSARGNLKGAPGDAGEPGPANTLAIGTVTTGAAGSAAAATITGTAPNQTLNLTIPRGDTGTNGQGVPTGGTVGQKLEKVSATNYDTAWVDSARVIVINNGAAVPTGTPAGTVIIEKNA